MIVTVQPPRMLPSFPITAKFISASIVAAVAGGCAGGPQLPGIPSMTAGGAGAISVGSLQGGEASHYKAASADVYARIARGANACWFGGRGRIAASHIMHADAAPSMNGGAVEIIVHERAVDQPKPWGYKAFRIALAESAGVDGTPGGGGTSISVENVRFPEAEGRRMRAEVFKWAGANEGCIADPALDKAPETAAAPPPPPAAPAKKAARAASTK